MASISNSNVVIENLAELLTNTVDMASVFYDIFLNPAPMVIHLKAFDDNNKLIDVTIPNRAMDRATPYTGEGSPEGVKVAPIGSVYIDTLSSTVYYKVSGEADDPYGWNAVISQSLMEVFIRTYLEARGYITTSALRTYLVTHEYVDVPYLESYLTENGYLRSGDLDTISEAETGDKTIVIEGNSGEVKGITIGSLITSMISSQEGNNLTIGEDNKLYVDNDITGVIPGTYVYPKNLVVNSGGRITSVEQGSQADITVATDVNYGVVRPDNTSIVVNQGVISVNGKANADLSNVTSIASGSAVKTALDGKLNTSGGTVGYLTSTGAITRQGSVAASSAPTIVIKDTSIVRNVAPSSGVGTDYLVLADKNGTWVGNVALEKQTDGKNTIKLQVYSSDGTVAPALRVHAYKNNTVGCDFPKCTTKATTTSSARSDLVATVVQNYVNGTSWYRVWSDGWKEQGGFTNAARVNFLKGFSDTNYTVSLTKLIPASLGADNSVSYVQAKWTGAMDILRAWNGGSATTNLFTMWYACGY